MKKSSSIWMAALTLTAVILTAVLLSSNDRPAQAAMLNAQTNVTMMTTGTNGGDEGLVIVDRQQQKMIVYLIKGNELAPIAGKRLN
jgi:hypothetical protein